MIALVVVFFLIIGLYTGMYCIFALKKIQLERKNNGILRQKFYIDVEKSTQSLKSVKFRY